MHVSVHDTMLRLMYSVLMAVNAVSQKGSTNDFLFESHVIVLYMASPILHKYWKVFHAKLVRHFYSKFSTILVYSQDFTNKQKWMLFSCYLVSISQYYSYRQSVL